MYSQIIVFAIILITLYLFIDGRIRYDFVALLGLITLTITRVIPPETSFAGFSHPAIITVASVLVISSALIKTGVIDNLVALINKGKNTVPIKVLSLMVITAILSAFINNVGALALIMPIALTISKDNKIAPYQLLMPVAFASLLGGMITGIGTPPNLIVSTYRMQAGFEPFPFFSYAPVGVTMAVLGIIFTTLIGWRLIPKRDSKNVGELFNIEEYLFELIVTDNYKLAGKTLLDFYKEFKIEMNVLSIIRSNHKIIAPRAREQLLIGDIIIIKALSTDITNIINKTGLKLKTITTDVLTSEPHLKSDEVALVEVVLREDSFLIGRTAIETRLRNRYNVNLVAVSRKGVSSIERLKTFRFQRGDVLLIQVPESILQDTYSKLRFLPLQARGVDLNVHKPIKNQIITLGIFLVSIMATTLGLIPVQIAFSFAAVLLVLTKMITPREFYEAIEWPTIIMLGSLFALGNGLSISGASDSIAGLLMKLSFAFSPGMMVGVLMVMTMAITNLISSSATAVLMGPIALSLAVSMGVSPDPLLMAVSVASSSAFLTPIGHQSNILVMGPGGYKFKDYWRLGLPLSLMVLLVGTPLILYIWPF